MKFNIVEYQTDGEGNAVTGAKRKHYGPFTKEEAVKMLEEFGATNSGYLSCIEFKGDRTGDWEDDSLWVVPLGDDEMEAERAFELVEISTVPDEQ